MPNQKKKRNKNKKKTKGARRPRRRNLQCANEQVSSSSSEEEDVLDANLEQLHPDGHMSNLLKQVLTSPMEYYLVSNAPPKSSRKPKRPGHYNLVENQSTGELQVIPRKNKSKTNPAQSCLNAASHGQATSSHMPGELCPHQHILSPATRKKSAEIAEFLSDFFKIPVVYNAPPSSDSLDESGNISSGEEELRVEYELIAQLEHIARCDVCNCSSIKTKTYDAQRARLRKIARARGLANAGNNVKCERADASKPVTHSRSDHNVLELVGFNGVELSGETPDDNCILPTTPNCQDECVETDTITKPIDIDISEFDPIGFRDNEDTQGGPKSAAGRYFDEFAQELQELDWTVEKINVEECLETDIVREVHNESVFLDNEDTQGGPTSDAVMNLDTLSQAVQELGWVVEDISFEECLEVHTITEVQHRKKGFLNHEDAQGGSTSDAELNLDTFSQKIQEFQPERNDDKQYKPLCLPDDEDTQGGSTSHAAMNLDSFTPDYKPLENRLQLCQAVRGDTEPGEADFLCDTEQDMSDNPYDPSELMAKYLFSMSEATNLLDAVLKIKQEADAFNSNLKSTGSVDAKKHDKENIPNIDTADINVNKPNKEHTPKKDTTDIEPASSKSNGVERVPHFNAFEGSSGSCVVAVKKCDKEHKLKKYTADSAEGTADLNPNRKPPRPCSQCDRPRKERKHKKVKPTTDMVPNPYYDPSKPGTSSQADEHDKYYNLAIQLYQSKMNQAALEEQILACGHSDLLYCARELGDTLERKERNRRELMKLKEEAREEEKDEEHDEKDKPAKKWKGKGKGKGRKK